MTARRSTAQERAAKGLCPRCGKEAAPYYLCADHRFEGKVVRILNRMASSGGVVKDKRDGTTWYTYKDGELIHTLKWRGDPLEGDKRLRPRLGRVPADVENELMRLLVEMGRPATIEEIIGAWGKLREKRKRASLVGDLKTIIESSRHQADKRERRAARWTGAR